MKVKVRFAQPTTLVKTELHEEYLAKIASLERENEELRGDFFILERNKNLLEMTIETLNQKIAEMEHQRLQSELEYKKLKSKFSDTCAERDNFQACYKQVQNEILAKQRELYECQAQSAEQITNYDEQIFELKEEVARWKKAAEENAEIAKKEIEKNAAMEAKIDELSAELVKHEMNHYKEEVDAWQKIADDLANNVRDLTDENKALDRRTHELESYIDELHQEKEELVNEKNTYVEAYETLRNKLNHESRPVNLWKLLIDNGLINLDIEPRNNT